jgi:hypothetical protein
VDQRPATPVTTRFVYGSPPPDFLIRDGETYVFVTDHVGSVRLVVGLTGADAGQIVQEIEYDPFEERARRPERGLPAVRLRRRRKPGSRKPGSRS